MSAVNHRICPAHADPCNDVWTCDGNGLCVRMGAAPIDMLAAGVRPALHFVGFDDPMRYDRAVRVFGKPDIIHRTWDRRAVGDVVAGWDTVVFARYHDRPPSPYAFDDSNQPDDPAARER